MHHIKKYVSSDGLTLYEATGQPEIRDRVTRLCSRRLRLSTVAEDSPVSDFAVQRDYVLYGRYIDPERGMFVVEYREDL